MRSASVLLLICACVPAQPVRNLAVTVSGGEADLTIHLRNQYSSPATAWILQCLAPGGGSRYYWHDQELSFESKPVAPGEEIEFRLPTMPAPMRAQMAENGNCTDFRPIAAVFADGTVSGDFQWIEAVAGDRRQAMKDIAKAREILGKAKADAAVQELTEWGKSETPGGRAPRAIATNGVSWGRQSLGTAPPPMRMNRSPVPGAALWLLETQSMKPAEAAAALAEWSVRLQKVAAASDAPAPIRRMMSGGPFTPRAEAELVGKPAPDFTLQDMDGREVSLSSLKGKPVLLDFWATWCEPCRESMPHVQSLYDRFREKGLVVLGIDINEAADLPREYFAKQKFTFGNLIGAGSGVVPKYGANSIPRVVLIDRDGVVRYVHGGWGSGEDLTPEVKKVVEP
jgi:peroxiredoxin